MSEHEIWLIYSREHNAWWRPKAAGYTFDMASAGRYDREAASAHCNTRDWQRDGSVSEFMVPDPDELDRLQALNSDLLAALKSLKGEMLDLMEDFDGMTDRPSDVGRFHSWQWLRDNGRLDKLKEAGGAIKAAEKQSAGEQS